MNSRMGRYPVRLSLMASICSRTVSVFGIRHLSHTVDTVKDIQAGTIAPINHN